MGKSSHFPGFAAVATRAPELEAGLLQGPQESPARRQVGRPRLPPIVGGPGPLLPPVSGGDSTPLGAGSEEGAGCGAQRYGHPGKVRPRNFIFSCPPPRALLVDSVVPRLTPCPLRPGPSFSGGSWGQEALGRAACCQGPAPCVAGALPHTVGSQSTCWAPGPGLQADGQLKSGREAEPE